VIIEFAVPQTPVIRQMYTVYMTRVMSAVGDAVSRSHAYRYLSTSVEAWHNPESFCKLMADAGFKNSQARPLTFGIANLYTGLK